LELNTNQTEESTYETHKDKDENFIACREKIFMRRDNYLYFVATDGTPCDEGSRQLNNHRRLTFLGNLSIGEVKVVQKNKKYQFAIAVKDNTPLSTEEVVINLQKSTETLKLLLIKHKIKSISMAISKEIENFEWNKISKILKDNLKGIPTRIIVCRGLIKYVDEKDRKRYN